LIAIILLRIKMDPSYIVRDTLCRTCKAFFGWIPKGMVVGLSSEVKKDEVDAWVRSGGASDGNNANA